MDIYTHLELTMCELPSLFQSHHMKSSPFLIIFALLPEITPTVPRASREYNITA